MKNKYKIRRRIVKKVTEGEEIIEVNNPAWDAKLFKQYYREGREHEYEIPQFLERFKPIREVEEIEVLEYQVKCQYCGIKKWMKRKAKYCSASCRVMAYRERKKEENKKK